MTQKLRDGPRARSGTAADAGSAVHCARVARPWLRPLLFGIGWLCVGMGMLGLPLPGLPTTPFLLVALWCFSRSSARFEGWLLRHRILGHRLRTWRQHRVISLNDKLLAWGTMAASGAYLWMSDAHPAVLATAATLMLVGGSVIAQFPHRVGEHVVGASVDDQRR